MFIHRSYSGGGRGRCLSSRRLRSYSFRYTDVILPYDVSKRDAKDSRRGPNQESVLDEKLVKHQFT